MGAARLEPEAVPALHKMVERTKGCEVMPGPKPKNLPDNLPELYAAGLSTFDIAGFYDCSEVTAARTLARAGVELRRAIDYRRPELRERRRVALEVMRQSE